jgi:mannose-6-phosphate isomerase-like protein (cupin superfamily)
MKLFHANIEKEAEQNDFFRKVLFTGQHCQVVLMCLNPKEEIGMEVHKTIDQFFRIESGIGLAIIDDVEYELSPGIGLVVPAGSNHNIINTSETEKMKLYTIYSPANHPEGTIHKTKEEAMAAEDHE